MTWIRSRPAQLAACLALALPAAPCSFAGIPVHVMTTEEWSAGLQAELTNPATAEQTKRALTDPKNAILFNELLEKTRERSADAYNKKRADDLKQALARPSAAASAGLAGTSQSPADKR